MTAAERRADHRSPILAMGGEGGGVLADWIVDLAEQNGYLAQIDLGAGRRAAHRRDDLLRRAVSRERGRGGRRASRCWR